MAMTISGGSEAKKTGDDYRAEEREHRAAAQESFDRCDTDGFVSQWAHGLNAQLARAKAGIADAGGVATFKGLYVIATGERARAKKIDGKFGPCWAFVGADGQFTGKFLPCGPRSRKQKAEGFEERDEVAPATAVFKGEGRGLSGTCWVAVVRTDGGFLGAEGSK